MRTNWLLVISLWFVCSNAVAQTCASSVAPPASAAELIAHAADRLGGPERLRAIHRLRVSSEGVVSNGLQGYDPADVDVPQTRRPFARTVEFDFEEHRYRRISSLVFDGATLHFTDAYEAGRLWTSSPDSGTIWRREGAEAPFADPLSRYLPPLLVLRAMDIASNATLEGQACLGDAVVDRVDFSWNARTRLRVNIARDTQRILRLEAPVSDPILGSDTVTYDFSGELVAAGISFPQRTIYSRRGQPFTVSSIALVEVDPTFEDRTFSPPDGLVDVPPASPARQIGDGAYEIALGDGTDNYVQFFDLGDSVAIFDAPLSFDVSQHVAAEIERVLGDKPISYVILSHFHDDHAGGVGFYADLGAQIVTTRDSASIITRLSLGAPREAEGAGARAPRFLFVDGSSLRVRGSGGRSIMVYRLTNLPHVRSMLVAYYRPARMIANADLYAEFAPFDVNGLLFARWLARPRAPDVNWIVGGHHRQISRDDLQTRAAAFERAAGR